MTGRTPTVSAASSQNDLAQRSSILSSSPMPTTAPQVGAGQQEQLKPRTNDSYFNTIRADAGESGRHDDDWEKKMLCSEDCGSQHPSADPILDLAVSTFTELMGVAVMIDSGADQVKIQDAAAKVPKGKLDFSSLSASLFEQGMAAQDEQGNKLHV